MGFLDEVSEGQSLVRRQQSVCLVARWLETVDDEVRAEFAAAIDKDSGYDATVIFKVMRARGADFVTVNSVRRHRRRECLCE